MRTGITVDRAQRDDQRDAPLVRTLQIGMTAARASSGGLDRYYFSLLRELPEQRIGVRGLVVGESELLDGADGIESFAPESRSLLRRWSALRGPVSRMLPQTDLVVSHFAPYAFPVLDQIGRRPMLVHFHGPWALESAAERAGRASVFAKRALERIVYARGNRFVVLSEAYAGVLEREYGVARGRIRIVPGGVDVRRFATTASRRDARSRLGWSPERPTVVTARRLVRAKGLENLIDAVSEVRRSVPDVEFVIVGTGPQGPELQRRVQELDLQRWVRFAGYFSDEQLPLAYRAADVFVVPTVALEGFGLVVLEALACGTPTLVTPVAGLPEVVRDLDPGLILAGSRGPEIARGIADALTGRRPLPHETACIAYARRFDWPVIAQRVAAVYRETV